MSNANPPAKNTLPVFALDASSTWFDLLDAIAGNANYQLTKTGKVLPLLAFAPMTEPENLDRWEPLSTYPKNLLLAVISPKLEGIVLKALQQAEPVLGPLHHVAQCPALKINFEEPIAQVYQQMAIAGMRVLTYKYKRPKSRAIFLLRGLSAVEAFDRELRNVTR